MSPQVIAASDDRRIPLKIAMPLAAVPSTTTLEKPETLLVEDRRQDVSWDCAFCRRLRVCPFAPPYPRGPAALETCQACGNQFVDRDDRRAALVRAISDHLV